jgi:hypothetical protein
MWKAINQKTGQSYEITDAEKTQYETNAHLKGKYRFEKLKEAKSAAPAAPAGVTKDAKK